MLYPLLFILGIIILCLMSGLDGWVQLGMFIAAAIYLHHHPKEGAK